MTLSTEGRGRLSSLANAEVHIDPKLKLPADYDPLVSVLKSDLKAALAYIDELEGALKPFAIWAEMLPYMDTYDRNGLLGLIKLHGPDFQRASALQTRGG